MRFGSSVLAGRIQSNLETPDGSLSLQGEGGGEGNPAQTGKTARKLGTN